MLCTSITLCLLNCILTLFRWPRAGNTFLEDRKLVSPPTSFVTSVFDLTVANFHCGGYSGYCLSL